MRCPNCGNENPDDYTFCDECGAKLTAQDGEAASMPATAEPGFTPVSTMSGPMDGVGAGAPDGASEASSPAAPMAAGGVCPNCGAATVPGEAYCNECGAELPTATTTASDAGAPSGADGAAQEPAGAAPGMGPYVGMSEMNAQRPEGTAGGPMPEMPAAMGDHDYEAAMPVSEDTMPAATTEGAGAAPMAPAEPEMPGVVPMAGADAEAPYAEAPYMEAPPVAPAYAEATTDARGWATNALGQLEDAQQAMARGDWVAYGQSMSDLKSFLESVVQGAAPSMPMPAAPTMPAPPAMTPATDISGMPPVPGMADMVAPQSTAPAAEPAYAAAPSTGARLVVISTGAEMPLPQQDEITVGREDPSSGIFPDIDLTPYGGEDGGVSRRHARMLHVGNDYFIEDLQSTNYTKLDGQRLPARVREKLEDGARIDFGRVAVIFRRS